MQGHDGDGAVESIGVDEGRGHVVVHAAGGIRCVVVGLRSAEFFWWWRACDGGARRGVAVLAVGGEV